MAAVNGNPALGIPLKYLSAYAQRSPEQEQQTFEALQIFQRQFTALRQVRCGIDPNKYDFLDMIESDFSVPLTPATANSIIKKVNSTFRDELKEMPYLDRKNFAFAQLTLGNSLQHFLQMTNSALSLEQIAVKDCLPRVIEALSRYGKIPSLEGLTPLELHNKFLTDPSLKHAVSQVNFLDLSHLGLTRVPSQLLVEFQSLATLDLSHNFLAAVPDLWGLPNLGKLNLDHNCFTQAPFSSDCIYRKYPLEVFMNHNILTAAPPRFTPINYTYENNPLRFDYGHSIQPILQHFLGGIPDMIAFFRSQLQDVNGYDTDEIPKISLFSVYCECLRLNFQKSPFAINSKAQNVIEALKALSAEDQMLIASEKEMLSDSSEWSLDVLYGALHNTILSKYHRFRLSGDWMNYVKREPKQQSSPECSMTRLAYLVEHFSCEKLPPLPLLDRRCEQLLFLQAIHSLEPL